MPVTAEHINALIEEERVHRDIYTDPEIFDLEMKRLFGRAWILLGHESQAPNRGDYFTTKIAREAVIVVRNVDGGIKVLHNRCAHRGAIVCGNPCGNANKFTCPYHAWTYDLNGKFVGMPLKEEYPADFDFLAHGLKELSGVELYRGFIFGNLDPGELDLLTFLGGARARSLALELTAAPCHMHRNLAILCQR